MPDVSEDLANTGAVSGRLRHKDHKISGQSRYITRTCFDTSPEAHHTVSHGSTQKMKLCPHRGLCKPS